MSNKQPSVINIGLVGGETYCEELLGKTSLIGGVTQVTDQIVAVADSNPSSPGMALAKELGLITVSDYHDLYDPRHNIQLIIVLTPEAVILDDILQTRPPHILLLS